MAKENERLRMSQMAEGVRFELTREQSPLPVFKTGALNHSATLPAFNFSHLVIPTCQRNSKLPPDCHPKVSALYQWRSHPAFSSVRGLPNAASIISAARSSLFPNRCP